MAEIVLFHHAQGLTRGCLNFAERLRYRGHVVHTPDLYEGRTFKDLEEGVAFAQSVGFDVIAERGRDAAEDLDRQVVYAGFSLGVMPAQALAQTKSGTRGAILMCGFLPPSEFGGWPGGVAAQIHAMSEDPWFAEDLAAARDLADTTEGVELFLYSGGAHLFMDDSLGAYDDAATTVLEERVALFLDASDTHVTL